jgi:hypothetical protein
MCSAGFKSLACRSSSFVDKGHHPADYVVVAGSTARFWFRKFERTPRMVQNERQFPAWAKFVRNARCSAQEHEEGWVARNKV